MIVEKGESLGLVKYGGLRKSRLWKNLGIIFMDVIWRLKDCEKIFNSEVI